MKKRAIFLILLIMLPTLLFASVYQSLYTLEVPYKYQSLYVNGNFVGDEALKIEIDTSPTVTFAADIALEGDYSYDKRNDKTEMSFNSTGSSIRIGSTGLRTRIAGSGGYKNYAFNIASLPAFYRVYGAGNIFFDLPFGGGTTTFFTFLVPSVGVGIGKINQIETIRSIINTMEYFGIEPTTEKVKEIATIEYKRREHFNTYSNNDALLWASFQHDLASAYGVEERIVEFIYRNDSQELSYETARWRNLVYGWEAYGELRPTFLFETSTTNTFAFTLGIALGGRWATLLLNDDLYFDVKGALVPTIDTAGTSFFYFTAETDLHARYFFSDPRMYVDALLSLEINTKSTPKVDVDFDAIFNYLIAPNFVAFGGVEMVDTFDKMSIVAGGNLRLF